MHYLIPPKLKPGDSIMVIAPSDSLKNIQPEVLQTALKRFNELGLMVHFAKNVYEMDETDSASISSRATDIHEAFSNKEIKAVVTAFGGYNCNQLLPYLDWELIKKNPKILIGFSDTTALQNAILEKTGIITYSGPSFARFGQELYFEYTLNSFIQNLFSVEPYTLEPSTNWNDDWWAQDQSKRQLHPTQGWVVYQEGNTTGRIVGGNLSTLNLLQGTQFMPSIKNKILFLEDDNESQQPHFDRDLESLTQTHDFNTIQGLVIGRFQTNSHISIEVIKSILNKKRIPKNIPVLINVDFGHTDPIFTFPIGGQVRLTCTSKSSAIELLDY